MKTIVIKAILSGTVICLLTGPALYGAATQSITWDWNLSYDGGTGTGTFTTDDTTSTVNDFTGYQVISMDGTFDGDQVTLLAPGTYDSNDNLLSSSDPQVSGYGISFSTASADYNIFYSSVGGGIWVDSETIASPGILKSESLIRISPRISDPTGTPPAGGQATFTANTIVPEPGVFALGGPGALGVWYFRRRFLAR